MLNRILLFVSQRIHRVRSCGRDGLVAYRENGDQESQQGSGQKVKEIHVYMIGKVLQPAIQEEVSHGPGDQVGNEHPESELSEQKYHDGMYLCAQGLADADLLGLLFGHERGKTKQPQAGNEDGKGRENPKDLTGAELFLMHGLVVVVEEEILEGLFAKKLLPALFHLLHHVLGIGVLKAYRHVFF